MNLDAVTDKEMSCLFNQYFYPVFNKSSFRLPPTSELMCGLIPKLIMSPIYSKLFGQVDAMCCDGICFL